MYVYIDIYIYMCIRLSIFTFPNACPDPVWKPAGRDTPAGGACDGYTNQTHMYAHNVCVYVYMYMIHMHIHVYIYMYIYIYIYHI